MSSDFNALSSEAMSLPPAQRFELSQRLWQSLGGEVEEDEELFAEIARRCAEVDSGAVQTVSHEEVMRDARKTLGK